MLDECIYQREPFKYLHTARGLDVNRCLGRREAGRDGTGLNTYCLPPALAHFAHHLLSFDDAALNESPSCTADHARFIPAPSCQQAAQEGGGDCWSPSPRAGPWPAAPSRRVWTRGRARGRLGLGDCLPQGPLWVSLCTGRAFSNSPQWDSPGLGRARAPGLAEPAPCSRVPPGHGKAQALAS